MKTAKDLIELLTLESQSDISFTGYNENMGSPNVFGGQVLAQALHAACQSISNQRILHSMHGYFLEAGNLELPIHFSVEKVRDGGSFSVRRVTAKQEHTTIFILSASFQKREGGYTHQITMPEGIKLPEVLLSWTDLLHQFGDFLPKHIKTFFEIERPIEFKPTEIVNPMDRKDLPPFSDVWFKLKDGASVTDTAMKQQILTYISDYNILVCALNPHASKAHFGNTQTASLDHSMWYFRDFDFEDWLLFSMESPNASGARGFARGNVFTREGRLVASVAQEGLMRPL